MKPQRAGVVPTGLVRCRGRDRRKASLSRRRRKGGSQPISWQEERSVERRSPLQLQRGRSPERRCRRRASRGASAWAKPSRPARRLRCVRRGRPRRIVGEATQKTGACSKPPERGGRSLLLSQNGASLTAWRLCFNRRTNDSPRAPGGPVRVEAGRIFEQLAIFPPDAKTIATVPARQMSVPPAASLHPLAARFPSPSL
jgi:hypothetical protein